MTIKHLEEYRGAAITRKLIETIKNISKRDVRLMEVCGTHTVSIFRSGIRSVLPPTISLLSGPGCPVCVTPLEQIDRALYLASRPDVIFTSFGDMLRVPGSDRDLLQVRAGGGETALAKHRGLGIVARNTTFGFKNRTVDIVETAKALGADYVVEGSVRRAGERVRVTEDLMELRPGNLADDGLEAEVRPLPGDGAELVELAVRLRFDRVDPSSLGRLRRPGARGIGVLACR